MKLIGCSSVIVVLLVTLTSKVTTRRLVVLDESRRDSPGMQTDGKYCVAPVTSDLPDCKVSFREDSGWTNQFNATCIRPNVFLVNYDRPSKQSGSSVDARRVYALPTDDSSPPPYVRFTCVATFPIDFAFEGNGAIEFLRVWKSVSYVNGTDTFDRQTLNVELLATPSATGRFVFYSIETPTHETSFFIFAEPPESPFLVTPGQAAKALTGKYDSASSVTNIPCIVSNRVAKVELFELTGSNWTLLGSSDQNTTHMEYTPETGFTFTHVVPVETTQLNFQCREGSVSALNFTVSVRNSSAASQNSSVSTATALRIFVTTAASCSGPEGEGPLSFFNVFVRNPTEANVVSECLLRGVRNCGMDTIYHKRYDGTPCEFATCATIPASQLHREGLLVCMGKTMSSTVNYFKGFDGLTYTDTAQAPASALLKVKVTQSGSSTFSNPSPTELVTGVRYEVKCNSVEFPFVKESQLLFVKYRNGSQELLAELVWWKAGIELYLTPDMIELECKDRHWTNNAFFNSSTPINVTDKPCTIDQFRCKSGQCIRDTWRCDGDNDCADSSDEANCHNHVCKPDFFKCLSGQCISVEKKCNNKRECPDGTDESSETCSSVICTAAEFKCQSGQCVLAQFLCDGDSDCYDRSDESQENCAKYYPTIVSSYRNVTIVEGSPGELICDTAPLPAKLQPRIEWWRHNTNITDMTRLWRNFDGSKLALKFSAANPVDDGDYTCFAENMLSRSFLTFRVKVIPKESTTDTSEGSNDFPCDYDLDQEDCISRLCKTHPRLTFCQNQSDQQLLTQVSTHTGVVPVWVMLLGTFCILLILILPAVYIWRHYRPNLRLPRGAVRFGQEDEVMMDRSAN